MTIFRLILAALLTLTTAFAAPLDERAAFGFAPGRDVDAALKRAAKENKNVLLFAYNEKGDSKTDNWPGLSIKYFTDLAETKKLLKQHFIVVCLKFGHKDLERYKPAGNAEQEYWVLISPSGETVKADKVYGNPTEGLKITKELAALK